MCMYLSKLHHSYSWKKIPLFLNALRAVLQSPTVWGAMRVPTSRVCCPKPPDMVLTWVTHSGSGHFSTGLPMKVGVIYYRGSWPLFLNGRNVFVLFCLIKKKKITKLLLSIQQSLKSFSSKFCMGACWGWVSGVQKSAGSCLWGEVRSRSSLEPVFHAFSLCGSHNSAQNVRGT